MFILSLSKNSKDHLESLKGNNSKAIEYKAVLKALKQLMENPRHPSLHSKVYRGKKTKEKKKIWQSYAQNNTPGAYRIFWHYGPNTEVRVISVIEITSHP